MNPQEDQAEQLLHMCRGPNSSTSWEVGLCGMCLHIHFRVFPLSDERKFIPQQWVSEGNWGPFLTAVCKNYIIDRVGSLYKSLSYFMFHELLHSLYVEFLRTRTALVLPHFWYYDPFHPCNWQKVLPKFYFFNINEITRTQRKINDLILMGKEIWTEWFLGEKTPRC